MEKLTYTVAELAEVLGIGKNAAYDLVASKGFPAIRINERRIIIPREGLYVWLMGQAGSTAEAQGSGPTQRTI